MKKLIIFDIDGTLTTTGPVGDECFLEIASQTFSCDVNETDWTKFSDTTDETITKELFLKHLSREALPSELDEYEKKYHDLLLSRTSETHCFGEVDGAINMLECLERKNNYYLAVATGNWESIAAIKLKYSGFNISHLPTSTSNDKPFRWQIINSAVKKSLICYGVVEFDQCIYVGDAIWDAKACEKIGMKFIGISSSHYGEKLMDYGASAVFDNYLTANDFIKSL